MPPPRNVLFITLDQWRGDCLSALGHPVVETPTLDALAARGVLFANHWANAAPCGPSRACLYTGTYQHRNRSILNGTPLDARFTNVALLARGSGLRPGALRLHRHLGRPAHRAAGRSEAVQLRRRAPRVPRPRSRTRGSRAARPGAAGSPRRASTSRPTRTSCTSRWRGSPARTRTGRPGRRRAFRAELSQTTFIRQAVVEWLERNGDAPFFVHASFIRPHPPRRNPLGYHDLYAAEAVGPFVGCATPEEEAAIHPLGAVAMAIPGVGAPRGRAGAPAAAGHLLRRAARGGRRAGTALRVPRRRAGWPSRPWSS